MASYAFDDRSGRFRDRASGRFISESAVRDAVDAVVQLSGERMANLAADFRAGTIDVSQFMAGMLSEIKAAQIAAAMAAYGGREQMNASRWGTVGQQIRQQYAYARNMVQDVLDGKQRMNGRLDSRSRLYAQAARQTFTAIQRRERMLLGFTHERNVLGESEHCPDCASETDRGWVPMGILSLPGTRRCRVNCACELQWRDQRATVIEVA